MPVAVTASNTRSPRDIHKCSPVSYQLLWPGEQHLEPACRRYHAQHHGYTVHLQTQNTTQTKQCLNTMMQWISSLPVVGRAASTANTLCAAKPPHTVQGSLQQACKTPAQSCCCCYSRSPQNAARGWDRAPTSCAPQVLMRDVCHHTCNAHVRLARMPQTKRTMQSATRHNMAMQSVMCLAFPAVSNPVRLPCHGEAQQASPWLMII